MKIISTKVYRQCFQLTRPYTIAYKTQEAVDNVIIEITTDKGLIGYGAASPSFEVTGEKIEDTYKALDDELQARLIGKNVQDVDDLNKSYLSLLKQTPAACAAVNIALYDLYAKVQNKPLVEVLGRIHHQMPTSITIGIKNVEETLQEAAEYVARGFTILKVKLGHSLEEDIARLTKLREKYGNKILLRVDPNQGYTITDLIHFYQATAYLDIELIEQPLKVDHLKDLRQLSEDQKAKIALDENLITVKDAHSLVLPSPVCGIFNIKLMKCGGITNAQEIASIAQASKIEVMWGCNDESIISIAAALHVAFATKSTRYIDLDGSLDLAEDVVTGGFALENGIMRTLDAPGLGVIAR